VILRLDHVEPVSILGDDERLRRLLLNLVENGIKYTPAGGQVTLSLKKEQNGTLIEISDTGIGIPLEEQEQIFQPFYRANEARAQGEGGVGLGLSIAGSIAEAHEGRIEVESTPGQRTVFTVFLPYQNSIKSPM
jgi:signal transduction histidine kinase